MTKYTITSLNELNDKFAPCVVTVGMFDGIHKYHYKILKRGAKIAKKYNLEFNVVTFNLKVKDFLNKDNNNLINNDQKAEFLRQEFNVNNFIELQMNELLMKTSYLDFIEFLKYGLNAQYIVKDQISDLVIKIDNIASNLDKEAKDDGFLDVFIGDLSNEVAPEKATVADFYHPNFTSAFKMTQAGVSLLLIIGPAALIAGGVGIHFVKKNNPKESKRSICLTATATVAVLSCGIQQDNRDLDRIVGLHMIDQKQLMIVI
ncbi:hypothetical protein FQA39_LY12885 [Lamprigera yunnana]|nr:hypothetical protein FQA39_LY12885 [Lamprigera yunnana]